MNISHESQPKNASSQPGANFTHLLAALTVLILLTSIAYYADRRATALEKTYAVTLARLSIPESELGIVLQQAAFSQPGLLPVYGSSELVLTKTPYRAFYFFATHPTGFQPFDIARMGGTFLTEAQDLAAVGPALRGKKVVISFTPVVFLSPQVGHDSYAGNFSRVHANGLVFSNNLSWKVKRQAAKRMLDYPETVENDPVLRLALDNLVLNTTFNDFIFEMIVPFGQVNNFIARLQDHYAVWVASKGLIRKIKHVPASDGRINWKAEIAQAEAIQKQRTTSNQLGIDNDVWLHHRNMGGFQLRGPGQYDRDYLANLNNTKEWEDFNILLEVLKQYGASPLILGRPINNAAYAAAGISPAAQQVYYQLLHKQADRYHFTLIDFQEYGNDLYFSVDFAQHTSGKGWVIVDHVLDDYYHDRLVR